MSGSYSHTHVADMGTNLNYRNRRMGNLERDYAEYKRRDQQRAYKPNLNRGPVADRNISTAHVAEKIHRARMYSKVHAKPSEQFELYQNKKPSIFYEPSQIGNIRMSDQDIRSYNSLINHENNRVQSEIERRGIISKPRYNSPTVEKINLEDLNDPERYFTGYTFGSNFMAERYEIDNAISYDQQIYDKFPEIIEGAPTAEGTDRTYMDTVSMEMEMQGEFHPENARVPFYERPVRSYHRHTYYQSA